MDTLVEKSKEDLVMKKNLTIFITVLIVLCFVGCSDTKESHSGNSKDLDEQSINNEAIVEDTEVLDSNSKEKPKIVLYRENTFFESKSSSEFSNLQPYLNYIGSPALRGKIYVSDELIQNINKVCFLGIDGSFYFGIIDEEENEKSDNPIERVRNGSWLTNNPVNNDKCKEMVDEFIGLYGKPTILYSDGSIVDQVVTGKDYADYHCILAWPDFAHYENVLFAYYQDGTIGILWRENPLSMLGYEPVIAANTILNSLPLISSPLISVSYVDISDKLTGKESYKSAKSYIIEFIFEGNDGKPAPIYESATVMLDDESISECYLNDISDEDKESLFSNGKQQVLTLDNILMYSDKMKLTLFDSTKDNNETTEQGLSGESNNRKETPSSHDTNSPSGVKKCIVCGKEATHSMTGIASGETEYYCTEHYQEIIDAYNKIMNGAK